MLAKSKFVFTSASHKIYETQETFWHRFENVDARDQFFSIFLNNKKNVLNSGRRG